VGEGLNPVTDRAVRYPDNRRNRMKTSSLIRPAAAPASDRSPFLPRVQPPEPFTLVLFGATGDLAARKLLPALYGLWRGRLLPPDFAVVGVGRRDKNDDAFRQDVRAAVTAFRQDAPATADGWDDFLAHVFYHRADLATAEGMQGLARRVHDLEAGRPLHGSRLFYLATDPGFFAPVVDGLAATGLARREAETPPARVVIEKPFGHDLASARELDRHLLRSLRPDQLYRIDHYLGKETVQNLLAFRFGNAIFEPLFNRQYVDHVQITVAETVGMEGRRGAFYDHAGALRDVVQNHLLQLLALVTMDPPATLKAGDLSDAKLKVLRSLVSLRGGEVARRVVRGQYGGGTVEGRPARAYRDEEAVAGDSNTETFVALRTEIENWRWAGVPFLLRTGKRLPRRVTEVAVQFKLPPLQLFRTVECEGDFCDLTEARPDVLAFRIQPDEGISLSFSAKRPGMHLDLEPVRFEFDYDESFHAALPEAYERLLLDALRGDATLFMRSDELEAAWEFVTPILEAWRAGPPPELPNYAAGTWGPAEANRLAEDRPGGWRYL
jgi:glucose-6-phosphate 1-dehydrogenase